MTRHDKPLLSDYDNEPWNSVAIVGHAADKFTDDTEEEAREVIRRLLTTHERTILVSGGCHIGGVDIFAEEEADKLGLKKRIFLPKSQRWVGGYRERNLMIAEFCTEAHCIVVEGLPPDYKGMTFKQCYHCFDARPSHVKSGGCWTVVRAERMGRTATWHIIGGKE